MSYFVRATRGMEWIAKRTKAVYGPGARGIQAVDERTGRVAGMLGYDSWTHNSAQISIALDTPIAWRALRGPAFEYPFVECKRGVLIALVSSANTRSLELTEHVGFRPTYRIEDAILPGVHLVLFEMTRKEWEAKQ